MVISMHFRNWIVEGPKLANPDETHNRYILRVAGFTHQVSTEGVPSCQERENIWGIGITNPYNLPPLHPATK